MGKSLLLCLFLFSIYSHVLAQYNTPKALVGTITKNPIIPLFSFYLNPNEQYFLNIGGPYIIRKCEDGGPHPIVTCESTPCALSHEFIPHQCPVPQNAIINGRCACQASAFNPFEQKCGTNQLSYHDFSMASLNPIYPMVTVSHVYYLCVPKSLLGDFPPGVMGMAGLSPSSLAIWNQLTPPRLMLEKKFAYCLPSDENPTNKGVIFIGGGPYKLGEIDARSMLSYTPFIKNPRKLNDYFLELKSISVNGKPLCLAPNAFDFDINGHGGVALVSVTPYTALRSDIYKIFIEAFSTATSYIPRVSGTKTLPFCFKSTESFKVPRIDLEFVDGKIWEVLAANLMKKVSYDVSCLAIVDGGPKAEHAVVIGLYQMENILLEFDVGRSLFGFSPSLGFVKASCGDFQMQP